MGLTRSEGTAVFNHVLDNVLGQDDTSPLKQSLLATGVENIFDLRTMDDCHIDTLMYNKSDTEANVHVKDSDKDLLRAFIFYIDYASANGNPLLN